MISKVSRKPDFTHFISLPFIRKQQRDQVADVQNLISSYLQKIVSPQQLRKASNMLAHLTLSMLSLPNKQLMTRATQILYQSRDFYLDVLRQTQLQFTRLGYFSRINYQTKAEQVTVVYLQVQNDQSLAKVRAVVDRLIKQLLDQKIVRFQDLRAMHILFNLQTKMYQAQQYHLTLFRFQNTPKDQAFKDVFQEIQKHFKALKFSLDFIDISTRFEYDASRFYSPLARVILQTK